MLNKWYILTAWHVIFLFLLTIITLYWLGLGEAIA